MEPYHLRRHDKAIGSTEDCAEILASVRTISLSMCADDEPYLITLNHGWDPEQRCLWFHSAPTGKKIDILRRNPRVWGMAVEDLGYLDGQCDHAYRSVMFGGSVTFVEDDTDKRHALEVMIRQHESDPEAVITEQLTEARVAGTTIGRIDIDQMSGKESLP
jgi:hypothetical protein